MVMLPAPSGSPHESVSLPAASPSPAHPDTMGLASDATYGVKAQLRARHPSAFFFAATLSDARSLAGCARENTIAVVDGNILLRQVAATAIGFEEYALWMPHSVAQVRRAAHVVGVAFDEPHLVTSAKAEEQKRRDGTRDGMRGGSWTHGDAYGAEELAAAADVHPILEDREGRLRLFDEVAARAIDEAAGVASDGGALIVDGADARGAARPSDEPRVPCVRSSRAEYASLRLPSAGEADIKLGHLSRAIRQAAPRRAELELIVTNDTDVIATELLRDAREARVDAP